MMRFFNMAAGQLGSFYDFAKNRKPEHYRIVTRPHRREAP
jgi:hypothetical protein